MEKKTINMDFAPKFARNRFDIAFNDVVVISTIICLFVITFVCGVCIGAKWERLNNGTEIEYINHSELIRKNIENKY